MWRRQGEQAAVGNSGTGSYYFSQLPHIRGWAPGRRAWKYYDVDTPSFGEAVERDRYSLFHHSELNEHFKPFSRGVYQDNADTWDARHTPKMPSTDWRC